MIQRGKRDQDGSALIARQLGKKIYVAGDQKILGYDHHRITKFQQRFQTAACQLEPFFYRLIAIGDPAHGQDSGPPFRTGQFLTQQFRRLFFHHDLSFKIQARRETQIFVGGARITVDTAMFAAAIGIDAGVEADIRAIVVGDDGFGRIGMELSGRRGNLVDLCGLRNQLDRLEAILRIRYRSAAA